MNRTWIELDREALAHNIRRYQSLLPAGCRIMGGVKADAYGHGARAVAAQLREGPLPAVWPAGPACGGGGAAEFSAA